MKISINKNAPVSHHTQIEIFAPIEKVWKTLTEIKNWPNWQKNVTKIQIDGDPEENKSFKWRADNLIFTSTIHTMKKYAEFGWTGKIFGAKAIHNWTFKELNSKTIVQVEESLQGIFPFIFKNKFQKNLEKGMMENLIALKNASETKTTNNNG